MSKTAIPQALPPSKIPALLVANWPSEADRAQTSPLANNQISERAFVTALIESRSRFLEWLAGGASLGILLNSLMYAIEDLSDGMIASLLLLDEDASRVAHVAAPNLPADYRKAIDGMRIGPCAGSCGTAMYTRRQVIVPDLATDPLWADYRQLALRHGLRACWSTPMASPQGDILGALALYYKRPRHPAPRDRQLMDVAAELASIAVWQRRGESPSAVPRTAEILTARELQIARLVAQGEPVKRIAGALRMSISTVYTHRARIFAKLGTRSSMGVARCLAKAPDELVVIPRP